MSKPVTAILTKGHVISNTFKLVKLLLMHPEQMQVPIFSQNKYMYIICSITLLVLSGHLDSSHTGAGHKIVGFVEQ